MRRIVGNVGAFKLPNGKYGFGRIFTYADVAFYKHIGDNEKDLPTTEDYAFIVAVYNSAVTEMKYVDKRPYADESEVTSPPKAMKDCISGEYSIYYANGKIVPSTYEQCKDLEVCAVWELAHAADRLMGSDKWLRAVKPWAAEI